MVHVAGDVGLFVSGGINTIGTVTELKQPAVYIDEEEFYRATRMRASAPARVALLRLMRKDVTAWALSKVWKDELHFKDDRFSVRIDKWVPVVTWLLCASIVLTLGLSFVVHGHELTAALVFLFVMLCGAFFVQVLTMHITFTIASRLAPMIEEVNEELPNILAEWRRQDL